MVSDKGIGLGGIVNTVVLEPRRRLSLPYRKVVGHSKQENSLNK